MHLRRPERASSSASTSAPTASIWTQLDAGAPHDAPSSSRSVSASPAARSGHAMTFLPPAKSVLLFGGADGKIFFEDVFLLEPAEYGASTGRSGRVTTRSTSRSEGEDSQPAGEEMQWKRLVVSRGTSLISQSLRSPMFSSANSTGPSPRAIGSGVEKREPTFVHPGGGRDYHSMHYVQSSAGEERARGMRVLVVGNVVVASDEAAAARGGGTQSEGGAGNAGLAFDAPTLRVEELRVRQPLLDAQWEVRRVDHSSMWKPRARHAHSSVVVRGEQVFVFGGKDATSSAFFNDIFYYDAALNQWVKPTINPTGQLPQPRAFAGLTASDDGNTLFLFGGMDSKQEFGSLFLYDVAHSRWDSLAGATLGDRPSCRINHSLTFAAPNHLVLFGGRRRAVRQNELFIYNVSSHQWLDDLYLLSLPQTVLMQPPSNRISSRSTTSQRTRPTRSSSKTMGAPVHVALSAPQQTIQGRQSSQLARLPQQSPVSQSVDPLQQTTPEPSQLTQPLLPQRQQPPLQPVERDSVPTPVNSERSQQPQSLSLSSCVPTTPANSPLTEAPSREPSRSDTVQRATATTATTSGSGVLTDITNQSAPSSQKQQPALPRTSSTIVTGTDVASPGAVKKRKRRRLVEDSQDSHNSNSNSSNGSGELTTAQVGIQTTLLQLLHHQPQVEDTLARILSMLTREQTARQQQKMNQETLMRVHSEDQSKRLEAAARRNEALEGHLARTEAERAALHEKLMARETELYMHKHSLEASIPPLNARVQAIEDSHMQQLNVSRVIESKISAVHDFMDELRNAGGEGTEADDSPQRRLGCLDNSVATQPTPSPPKPLLYPQRVVLALEEKIRVMQSEKETLETQLKEMAEKLNRVEGREAQARQFLFSWCQGGNPPAVPSAATVPGTAALPTEVEPLNTGTDNMTNSVGSADTPLDRTKPIVYSL
ncbi:hypothetical protein KRP22_002410 [Phytophthora ramorum]|nr:Actin-fragmin kinase [Phytophthora ramorum]